MKRTKRGRDWLILKKQQKIRNLYWLHYNKIENDHPSASDFLLLASWQLGFKPCHGSGSFMLWSKPLHPVGQFIFNGPFQASISLSSTFHQLSVHTFLSEIFKSSNDDWIWTADFWCKKRPLYQLSHCPIGTNLFGCCEKPPSIVVQQFSVTVESDKQWRQTPRSREGMI